MGSTGHPVCQLAPSCAVETVATDERNGVVWVMVVVELVAGASVVVLTGDAAVVAGLGVAPHPASATSPKVEARRVAQRLKTFISRSVGVLVGNGNIRH